MFWQGENKWTETCYLGSMGKKFKTLKPESLFKKINTCYIHCEGIRFSSFFKKMHSMLYYPFLKEKNKTTRLLIKYFLI